MRFFIFLIVIMTILSCCVFGTYDTFATIFGRYPFWSSLFIVLIIIYCFISRNKNNYGDKDDCVSMWNFPTFFTYNLFEIA